MRIALAQIDVTVGDLQGNIEKIVHYYQKACESGVDLIVYPELVVTGYNPEDLQLRPDFITATQIALQQLTHEITAIPIIVGCPYQHEGKLFNAALVIQHQKIIAWYGKHCLPNYGVFDEKRYYQAGDQPCVLQLNGRGPKLAILICEDTWFAEPAKQAKEAGAEILISIHASPFAMYKDEQRNEVYQAICQANQIPMLCCMLIGAQDDLCFDGGSRALDINGNIVAQADFFEEQLLIVEFEKSAPVPQPIKPALVLAERVYKALALGIRDYVHKNGFKGALIGLSGGIDSAVTLTLAVDALGVENVTAISMPSRYTSAVSLNALQEQAKLCEVQLEEISIEPMFHATLESLKPQFKGLPVDKTEENIQSRCRGILLMALSNKTGKIVLTTGNKSEMATGYATLYGDMAGGFAALKDVPKMLVFELARYRNSISYKIPEVIITRPPSAELAPNQKDEDSLPPYPVLDEVLSRFIDHQQSIDDIVATGIDCATVEKIVRMLLLNEYKRRQAPPGIKITEISFTRDRRYPMTSGRWWKR